MKIILEKPGQFIVFIYDMSGQFFYYRAKAVEEFEEEIFGVRV